MRIRLITITTRRSGAKARREEMREDDVLTVGRGTDNDVSLAGLTVSLHHARFHRTEDSVVVEAVDANVIRVNGVSTTRREVGPGDVVQLGSFELRVLPPGENEDLLLEIEEVERSADALDALSKRVRIGVGRGLLSERALAYLAILAVAALCLALPWKSARWLDETRAVSNPTAQADAARAGGDSAPSRAEALLAQASVSGVQSWSIGPISAPHRQFAQECGRCHAVGFEQVRDAECLDCHSRVEAHAEADVSPPELSGMTCTACHTEHRGAAGLSLRQENACAPCHSELGELQPPSEHAVASSFGTDHPQFRLTILEDPASGARERVTWRPDLQESTGLLFSHVRHVGQAVEDRATGGSEYMRCDSCHVADASGVGYEPVGFEERCQSCHALGFDDDFPERQALHGDPVKLREDLLGFYSAVALGGLVPAGRGPAVLRAAPGRPLSPRQREAALAWAAAEAAEASEFLLEGDERCGMCHVVVPRAARDGGDDVVPVQVSDSWLPRAMFTHRSHAPSPCSACHPSITVFDPEASPEIARPSWAERGSQPYGLLTPEELARAHPGMTPSDDASDVSIPALDDCRSCHLGPEAPVGFVASPCGLCHDFHRRELGPMAETMQGGSG